MIGEEYNEKAQKMKMKMQEMIAADSSAGVVWLEHSGHMGFLEEPKQCAEAIKNLVLG